VLNVAKQLHRLRHGAAVDPAPQRAIAVGRTVDWQARKGMRYPPSFSVSTRRPRRAATPDIAFP
jgi:hypothetical protein